MWHNKWRTAPKILKSNCSGDKESSMNQAKIILLNALELTKEKGKMVRVIRKLLKHKQGFNDYNKYK